MNYGATMNKAQESGAHRCKIPARIRRGLSHVQAFAEANLHTESELTPRYMTARERREIAESVEWLGSLLSSDSGASR